MSAPLHQLLKAILVLKTEAPEYLQEEALESLMKELTSAALLGQLEWTPELMDDMLQFIMEYGNFPQWWALVYHGENTQLPLYQSPFIEHFKDWLEEDFANWFVELTTRNLMNELDWKIDYLCFSSAGGRITKRLASTYDDTVQEWWDEAQNIWNDDELTEDETEDAIAHYMKYLEWQPIIDAGQSWLINDVETKDYPGIWDKVRSYKLSQLQNHQK